MWTDSSSESIWGGHITKQKWCSEEEKGIPDPNESTTKPAQLTLLVLLNERLTVHSKCGWGCRVITPAQAWREELSIRKLLWKLGCHFKKLSVHATDRPDTFLPGRSARRSQLLCNTPNGHNHGLPANPGACNNTNDLRKRGGPARWRRKSALWMLASVDASRRQRRVHHGRITATGLPEGQKYKVTQEHWGQWLWPLSRLRWQF